MIFFLVMFNNILLCVVLVIGGTVGTMLRGMATSMAKMGFLDFPLLFMFIFNRFRLISNFIYSNQIQD